MKVLIIGLDGATWNVLDAVLLKDYMPNLKRLKDNGYSGVLQSTVPPITPVAWTTCITGCKPQTHGIFGWYEYSFEEDLLTTATSNNCIVPNMWQELSYQGYKIASINVPGTYPCPEVNGVVVAGFGFPGLQSEFTYPKNFKNEIMDTIADYDVMAKWNKSAKHDSKVLEQNLKCVERSFEQRLEVAKIISHKTEWDVMMVQFQDTDLIAHVLWPYLDKNTRDNHGPQRDRLFKLFKRLDEIIGELLALASTSDLMVAVVSDHGLCRRIAEIKPNVLLAKWGYLKAKSSFGRKRDRWAKKINLLRGKTKRHEDIGSKQPTNSDFNWRYSKAMVVHAPINGHLFLNVKGRQPHGNVEPGQEYENILLDLKKRFEQCINPENKERVFETVDTPEKVYGATGEQIQNCADLILVPKNGYELKVSWSNKRTFLKSFPLSHLEGSHHRDGIYLFSGTNVNCNVNRPTHIENVAPTIYAALGAKLPSYLDGCVLESIFVEKKPIRYYQSQLKSDLHKTKRKILSEEEEFEVTKRLSALGYIE